MLVALDRESPVPLRRQLAGALRDGIRAGPAAHRRPPARVARARRGARRLARRRHRRLRAADGRGLAGRQARSRHRRGGRAGPRAAARRRSAQRPCALRLHADDARRLALPAPPVGPRRRACGGGGSRRGARLRQRLRQPRAARGAGGLPRPRPGDRRRARRRSSSAPATLQATRLLFAVLAARGVRRVAFEDPSLADHWDAALRAGLEPVPIALDAEGLRVDALEAADADVVVVTPEPPVPDRRRHGTRAAAGAARVGERGRAADRRGRLRRRVPLRPPAARRAARPRPRARRRTSARRRRCSRRRCAWAGSWLRPRSPRRSRWRSSRPTPARPRSTSSRSRT